jgi:NAD+ synthase
MLLEEIITPIMLKFSKDSLTLDAELEVDRIVHFLTETVHQTLHRQGAVVGISGGVDSALVLALCVNAFGAERVIALMLPEKESSPENIPLAQELATQFGVKTYIEDITHALEGYGCYRRRDEAIRRVFPDYQPGWKVKIILPGDLLESGTLNLFHLVVATPNGEEYQQRLPLKEYYQIVAASNIKQRARTTMLYHYAELHNYAVIGTGNKNEHELGFFVKYGDGGSDAAPIHHLFKTQVYQLAEFLGVPQSILHRPPSTDTYPGGGTQEEFFYRIPFYLLDTIWYGYEHGITIGEIAKVLDLKESQVYHVIEDIRRKKHTTESLRLSTLEISTSHRHFVHDYKNRQFFKLKEKNESKIKP